MARSRNTTSDQPNEAQRDEAATSSDSTSLISSSPIHDESKLSLEDEQAEIKDQADTLLGKDDPNEDDIRDRIKVKSTGSFLVYDPTTGLSAGETGGEMILTPFVQNQLDEGRLEKA